MHIVPIVPSGGDPEAYTLKVAINGS
jgi:hypothetical protein